MKAETEQEKKEIAEREPYLGMRGHEPLLKYPGFNALFYTPSPRGSPEVANLSNTIESGIKYTEIENWPFL